jgi:hypothetical protein
MKPKLKSRHNGTVVPRAGLTIPDSGDLPTAGAEYAGQLRYTNGVLVACVPSGAGYAWVGAAGCPAFLTFHTYSGTSGTDTWSNMPLALTKFMGLSDDFYTRRVDLSHARQARLALFASTGGVAGADLLLRYSTDNSAWTTLTGTEATFGAGTGIFVSSWADLPAGARADVFVSLWGQDGDGSADPVFRWVYAEFR